MLNFPGPKATEKEMASHINALMMAGVITTSTFLSGVIYYLMTNPKSFNKLKTELRSTFTSVDDITCASTAKCEYLTAVIKEGLRIYPPAGGAHLPRLVPPEGAWISGYWVPGGVSGLRFGSNTQTAKALTTGPRTDPCFGTPVVRRPRRKIFPQAGRLYS
jgi:hypothetical protein